MGKQRNKMTEAVLPYNEAVKSESILEHLRTHIRRYAILTAATTMLSIATYDGFKESKGATEMLALGYTASQIRHAYSMDGCYQYYPGGPTIGLIKSTLAKPWVELKLLGH
ncbi:MAG: hypothetical protein V1802_03415 [Candidatus Aenigmatarchaeota archaeon]